MATFIVLGSNFDLNNILTFKVNFMHEFFPNIIKLIWVKFSE